MNAFGGKLTHLQNGCRSSEIWCHVPDNARLTSFKDVGHDNSSGGIALQVGMDGWRWMYR